MDWCYIFYGISSQLAAILIATTPRFFFAQSLVANILWMLPWAIVCSKITMSEDNAWTYHGIAVGGSLLANFVTVLMTCVLWAWMLTRGWVSLLPVTRDVEDEEAKKTTRMEQEQARKQKKTDKETAREVKREARRTAKYGNDAKNIRAVQSNPTTTLEPPSNRSWDEVGVNMEGTSHPEPAISETETSEPEVSDLGTLQSEASRSQAHVSKPPWWGAVYSQDSLGWFLSIK